MENLELSLYLHIPFCIEKCDYCDFYSVPVTYAPNSAGSNRFMERYTEHLLWETERRLKEINPGHPASLCVPSIYIGGGTPSLLGTAGIALLLDGLKNLIDTSQTKEITVEANPGTANSAFLKSCRDHGATRLSLGIQSFNKTVLKAVGRKGCPSAGSVLTKPEEDKSIDDIIFDAAEVFGQGLSLDLISGLPGHNQEILLGDIEKCLSFNPGHVSLYAMTLEEGTPLALRNKNKVSSAAPIPSGENADNLWLVGRDALKKAGYEHYEISNFAASAACRSVHNIRYWQMKNWLGIGPAASGTVINGNGTGCRTSYAADVDAFNSAVKNRISPVPVIEILDRNTVIKETLLMGYRYCEGPDPVLFTNRFEKTIEETIPETLCKWQKKADAGSLHETIMCFLSSFLLDSFAELDHYSITK